MPTAAELVFKIQATGADELKKVEAAVRGVGEGTRLAGAQLKTFDATLQSLVSGGKTYSQALSEMARSNGVLSQSVRSTASELLAQMRAAEGDEEAIRKLSGAHKELVSQTAAASGAVRVFEGNLPIRAVENFLSKVLGLGPVIQKIFPLVGAVAFGEVIFETAKKVIDLAEKWDPVARAEKRAKDALDDYARSVDAVKDKLRALDNAALERALGKPAGATMSASDLDQAAQSKDRQAAILRALLEKDRMELAAARRQRPSTTFVPEVGNVGNDSAIQARIREAQANVDTLSAQVSGLMNDSAVLRREASAKFAEAGQAQSDQNDKSARPGLELAKRRAEEILRLHQELASAQGKELSGVDAINAKRDASIEKLRAENLLTKESLNLLNQIAVAEAKVGFSKALEKGQKEAARGAAEAVKAFDADEKRGDHLQQREYGESLRKEIAREEKAIASALRITGIQNTSDASGVQRSLEARVFGNARAVRSGGMSASGAAGSDLQARIAAAQQIYQIETRGLDLIADEDKRDEKYAEARLKREEQIFRARMQYSEQLDSIRERDLAKYQAESGRIFEAITDRTRSVSLNIGVLTREAALGLGRQMFENLASPVLQMAGHAIGGAIPGQNPGSPLGTLLHGTIFDSANSGKNGFQAKTTENTAKTVEWLSQIHSDLTGQRATDPSSATLPATSGLAGSSLGAAGTTLSGSLASAIGKASAFGNFTSGAGSVLSGYGLSTLLDPGFNLSTRLGAGAGIAGALGAGTYGIMSGIGQGGPGGALTAAGSAAGLGGVAVSNISKLLGAASPALSAIPIVGTILAAALPLIGSMFGNTRQLRQNQITSDLAQSQYLAPTALNVTQGMNGTYEDFDARGNLRTSSLSAMPTVLEPYITSRRLYYGSQRSYYDAPGSVTSPFSGSASGSGGAPVSNAPQTVIINAMDSESFQDFATRNHAAIGGALARNLQANDGPAAHMIRNVSGG